jgi:hypothetical protein
MPKENRIEPTPSYLLSGVQFEIPISNCDDDGIPVKSDVKALPVWCREKFTKSSLFGRSPKYYHGEKHKLIKKCFHAFKQYALDSKKENKLFFTLHHDKNSRVGIQLTLRHMVKSESPFDILYE